MAKKVIGFVKLQVPAVKQILQPPVGPALGQHGVTSWASAKSSRKEPKLRPV